MAKAATLAYVQAELAAGREFPDQNILAARAGVTKSAVSKWATEWETAGQITRIQSVRAAYRSRIDAMWGDLSAYLGSLPDTYDFDAVVKSHPNVLSIVETLAKSRQQANQALFHDASDLIV